MIAPGEIDGILEQLDGLSAEITAGDYGHFTENLSAQLEAFLPGATQFQATLLVLYAPVFALLAAFIFMVSRQMMDLEENEIAYEYLDGSTKDRFVHVDHFNNSPDIPVFLLSLKAGGLGLNLTSADTVILYDPWWNPTAEAQAMDRSHRIGQTKKVNCVKLIVKDSVEEKVLEYQKIKQDLFRDVVENSTEGLRSLSLEDFEFLLS